MRAMGIILAGGGMKNSRMGELAAKRAVAAMPVAGSYRSIDFALSNMGDSHIQKVAVLTQDNARSLNEHLSSSKWWDFGRKHGGMFLFTPSFTNENSSWYRGTADGEIRGRKFPVPVGYDADLRSIYGDYMKPPKDLHEYNQHLDPEEQFKGEMKVDQDRQDGED